MLSWVRKSFNFQNWQKLVKSWKSCNNSAFLIDSVFPFLVKYSLKNNKGDSIAEYLFEEAVGVFIQLSSKPSTCYIKKVFGLESDTIISFDLRNWQNLVKAWKSCNKTEFSIDIIFPFLVKYNSVDNKDDPIAKYLFNEGVDLFIQLSSRPCANYIKKVFGPESDELISWMETSLDLKKWQELVNAWKSFNNKNFSFDSVCFPS